MSEMIERVAHTLRWGSSRGRNPGITETDMPPLTELAPGIGEMYRRQARAAIAAMREPTEAMYAAAYATHIPLSQNDIAAIWWAMIDEALVSESGAEE